jgi:ubiquinone/menaquinone biosynthesis C-methylase UbiE
MTDLKNVAFKEGSVENLPFADEDFNIVTSNGALNLVPDKAKAFAEICRVLKPGGRLMVADLILTGKLPKEKDKIIKSWAQ